MKNPLILTLASTSTAFFAPARRHLLAGGGRGHHHHHHRGYDVPCRPGGGAQASTSTTITITSTSTSTSSDEDDSDDDDDDFAPDPADAGAGRGAKPTTRRDAAGGSGLKGDGPAGGEDDPDEEDMLSQADIDHNNSVRQQNIQAMLTGNISLKRTAMVPFCMVPKASSVSPGLLGDPASVRAVASAVRTCVRTPKHTRVAGGIVA